MQIDRAFLVRLRTLGMIEGVSTLVLFGIAMPLKYLAGMPIAVTVVGTVHGVLFLALVAMLLVGIQRVPIPVGLAAAGMVGAVFPFGPLFPDCSPSPGRSSRPTIEYSMPRELTWSPTTAV